MKINTLNSIKRKSKITTKPNHTDSVFLFLDWYL